MMHSAKGQVNLQLGRCLRARASGEHFAHMCLFDAWLCSCLLRYLCGILHCRTITPTLCAPWLASKLCCVTGAYAVQRFTATCHAGQPPTPARPCLQCAQPSLMRARAAHSVEHAACPEWIATVPSADGQ